MPIIGIRGPIDLPIPDKPIKPTEPPGRTYPKIDNGRMALIFGDTFIKNDPELEGGIISRSMQYWQVFIDGPKTLPTGLSDEHFVAFKQDLENCSGLENLYSGTDYRSVADYIQKELNTRGRVCIPLKYTGLSCGHAFGCILEKDKKGHIIAHLINKGEGSELHPLVEVGPKDKRSFCFDAIQLKDDNFFSDGNPTALRFLEVLHEFGTIRPTSKDYKSEHIYKLFLTIGDISPKNSKKVDFGVTSQRSGTCSEQVARMMLRSLVSDETSYKKTILSFKYNALENALHSNEVDPHLLALCKTSFALTAEKGFRSHLLSDSDYQKCLSLCNAVDKKIDLLKPDSITVPLVNLQATAVYRTPEISPSNGDRFSVINGIEPSAKIIRLPIDHPEQLKMHISVLSASPPGTNKSFKFETLNRFIESAPMPGTPEGNAYWDRVPIEDELEIELAKLWEDTVIGNENFFNQTDETLLSMSCYTIIDYLARRNPNNHLEGLNTSFNFFSRKPLVFPQGKQKLRYEQIQAYFANQKSVYHTPLFEFPDDKQPSGSIYPYNLIKETYEDVLNGKPSPHADLYQRIVLALRYIPESKKPATQNTLTNYLELQNLPPIFGHLQTMHYYAWKQMRIQVETLESEKGLVVLGLHPSWENHSFSQRWKCACFKPLAQHRPENESLLEKESAGSIENLEWTQELQKVWNTPSLRIAGISQFITRYPQAILNEDVYAFIEACLFSENTFSEQIDDEPEVIEDLKVNIEKILKNQMREASYKEALSLILLLYHIETHSSLRTGKFPSDQLKKLDDQLVVIEKLVYSDKSALEDVLTYRLLLRRHLTDPTPTELGEIYALWIARETLRTDDGENLYTAEDRLDLKAMVERHCGDGLSQPIIDAMFLSLKPYFPDLNPTNITCTSKSISDYPVIEFNSEEKPYTIDPIKGALYKEATLMRQAKWPILLKEHAQSIFGKKLPPVRKIDELSVEAVDGSFYFGIYLFSRIGSVDNFRYIQTLDDGKKWLYTPLSASTLLNCKTTEELIVWQSLEGKNPEWVITDKSKHPIYKISPPNFNVENLKMKGLFLLQPTDDNYFTRQFADNNECLIWGDASGPKSIEFPIDKLSFSIKEIDGKSLAVCDQFQDYILANQQGIEEINGLKNTLVLQHRTIPSKKIAILAYKTLKMSGSVIPKPISFSSRADDAQPFLVYTIDPLHGRLVPQSSDPLISLLYLIEILIENRDYEKAFHYIQELQLTHSLQQNELEFIENLFENIRISPETSSLTVHLYKALFIREDPFEKKVTSKTARKLKDKIRTTFAEMHLDLLNSLSPSAEIHEVPHYLRVPRSTLNQLFKEFNINKNKDYKRHIPGTPRDNVKIDTIKFNVNEAVSLSNNHFIDKWENAESDIEIQIGLNFPEMMKRAVEAKERSPKTLDAFDIDLFLMEHLALQSTDLDQPFALTFVDYLRGIRHGKVELDKLELSPLKTEISTDPPLSLFGYEKTKKTTAKEEKTTSGKKKDPLIRNAPHSWVSSFNSTLKDLYNPFYRSGLHLGKTINLKTGAVKKCPVPLERVQGIKKPVVLLQGSIKSYDHTNLFTPLVKEHFGSKTHSVFDGSPFNLSERTMNTTLAQDRIDRLRRAHDINLEKTTVEFDLKTDRKDLTAILQSHRNLHSLTQEKLHADLIKMANRRDESHQMPLHARAENTITLDTGILEAVINQDAALLQKLNPSLSDEEANKIFQLTIEYMIETSMVDQLDSALFALNQNKVQECAEILNRKRLYNPYEEPLLILYEYATGNMFREEPNQAELLLKIFDIAFTDKSEELKRLFFEFQAGGGKTKVISAILAAKAVKMGKLPVFFSLPELHDVVKEDLLTTLMQVFTQKINPINLKLEDYGNINRYTIEKMQTQCELDLQEGRCQILTPEGFHTILLAYQQAQIENDKKLSKAIKDLLDFYKKNGVFLVDESHRNVDSLLQAIVADGKPSGLSNLEQDVFLNVYDYLTGEKSLTLPDGRLIKDVVRLTENKQALTSDSDLPIVLRAITEKLVDNPTVVQAILDKTAPTTSFQSLSYEEAQKCYLLRGLCTVVLPFTLSQVQGMDYGSSIQQGDLIDSPRQFKNPTTNKFESPDVASALTIQGFYQRGLSDPSHIEKLLTLLKTQYDNEIESYKNPEDCPSYILLKEWGCTKPLNDINDSFFQNREAVMQVMNEVGKNPQVIRYFLYSFALPQVAIYPYKLSSTAAELMACANSAILFSATLGSMEKNPRVLGPENYLENAPFMADVIQRACMPQNSTLLWESETTPDELLNKIQATPNLEGMINLGGFCKHASNLDWAKSWLKTFPQAKAVLFKAEDKGERVYFLLTRDRAEPQRLASTNVDKELSNRGLTIADVAKIYGPEDCTGTDLKLSSNATMVLTMGENTSISPLVQAIMRERQFLKSPIDPNNCQKLLWVAPEELKPKMGDVLGHTPTGVADCFLWSIEQEAVREESAIVARALQEIEGIVHLAVQSRIKSKKRKIAAFRKPLGRDLQALYGHETQKIPVEEYLKNYTQQLLKSTGVKLKRDEKTDILRIIAETKKVVTTVDSTTQHNLSATVQQKQLQQQRTQATQETRAQALSNLAGVEANKENKPPAITSSIFWEQGTSSPIAIMQQLTPQLTFTDNAASIDSKSQMNKPIDYFLIIGTEREDGWSYEYRAISNAEALNYQESLSKDIGTFKGKRLALMQANGNIVKNGQSDLRIPKEEFQALKETERYQEALAMIRTWNGKPTKDDGVFLKKWKEVPGWTEAMQNMQTRIPLKDRISPMFINELPRVSVLPKVSLTRRQRAQAFIKKHKLLNFLNRISFKMLERVLSLFYQREIIR